MYLSLPLVEDFPTPPPMICRSFLDVLKCGFKIASFSKPQNPTLGAQKAPKKPSKPSPKPSQNRSKTALILQTPEIKNNATLPRFCSFLTFPGLAKSSQNRCQNGFKICVFLETLLEAQKTRFCKLKSSQDGPQNFPKFSKIGQIRLPRPTVQHFRVGFAPHGRQNATRQPKSSQKASQNQPRTLPNTIQK